MDDAGGRFDFERFMRVTPSDMQRRMQHAADLVRNRIHVEAQAANMGGSLAEYLRNVAIVEVTDKSFAIELHGKVPNFIEQGLGEGGIGTYTGAEFDMRAFILKPGTRNLRYTNAGIMFVNVPMKHSVEQIANLGGGRVAVNAARALAPTLTDNSGKRAVSWGGRLEAGYGVKLPHWTTDALHGLVRQVKTYSEGTQATYKTWRRITELGHGNDEAWWSKGVEPRAIFKKVAAKMGEILAMVKW